MIDVQIKPKDDTYPMLMQMVGSEDLIVLFENPHSGWIMNWEKDTSIAMWREEAGLVDGSGRYSNDWDIELFEECPHTLELRNV